MPAWLLYRWAAGRPDTSALTREPLPICGLGRDGTVLGNEGVARGGGEHAGAVVSDDGAMVITCGEGDSTQLVEREHLRAGDIAGALQRRADADIGYGLGDVGRGDGLNERGGQTDAVLVGGLGQHPVHELE